MFLEIHEQDHYCLNDLHKAAGDEAKYMPANWLQNNSAAELIAELDKDGVPSIGSKHGRNGGTYAYKELAYA